MNIENGGSLCYISSMTPSGRERMPKNNPIRTFTGRVIGAVFCSLILSIGTGTAPAETKERIQIGAVEEVVLLPWGVTLPARIDTGAATTSLDARNLKIQGKFVEFSVPEPFGAQRIRLPILKWITVKTSEAKEKRPVVMLELCIGSKRIETQVNLNDRSKVKYPLLIGRNTLMHGFAVACDESYCAKPSCPGIQSK